MRCLEQTLSNRIFYGVEVPCDDNQIVPQDAMEWAAYQYGVCTSLEPNIENLVWYWHGGVMWFNSEDKRNLFLLRWE